jgi:hypothetical protein
MFQAMLIFHPMMFIIIHHHAFRIACGSAEKAHLTPDNADMPKYIWVIQRECTNDLERLG